MVVGKKVVKSHAFIHQEVIGLFKRSNSKVISLEQPLLCVIEQSQEALGHSEAQDKT